MSKGTSSKEWRRTATEEAEEAEEAHVREEASSTASELRRCFRSNVVTSVGQEGNVVDGAGSADEAHGREKVPSRLTSSCRRSDQNVVTSDPTEGNVVERVKSNNRGAEEETHGLEISTQTQTLRVLVNNRTASASEIVASALHDNCKAVIVGERTYGKGLIQSVYELFDGSGLVVTIGKYVTPNHMDINGNGIEPDFSRFPGRFEIVPDDVDRQVKSQSTISVLSGSLPSPWRGEKGRVAVLCRRKEEVVLCHRRGEVKNEELRFSAGGRKKGSLPSPWRGEKGRVAVLCRRKEEGFSAIIV
ncbi:hypothetical protein M5K25_008566 [Dendrobium thyrsiflorum]|uniref:Tail specific protease domain-containing protein n=1 Tax=Dendrobium thyrsiflorum TaxID=117978 RepID=A0ABD0V912_DENTH